MIMMSNFCCSDAQVRNTIRGFIVGTSSTDQVFWKSYSKAKSQHILDEELANEQVKKRFRTADPGEVMRHKNVVTYVHHRGRIRITRRRGM